MYFGKCIALNYIALIIIGFFDRIIIYKKTTLDILKFKDAYNICEVVLIFYLGYGTVIKSMNVI